MRSSHVAGECSCVHSRAPPARHFRAGSAPTALLARAATSARPDRLRCRAGSSSNDAGATATTSGAVRMQETGQNAAGTSLKSKVCLSGCACHPRAAQLCVRDLMLEHLGQHSDLHLAFEPEHACHGCMHSQLQHSALVQSMRHSNRALAPPASLRACVNAQLSCCTVAVPRCAKAACIWWSSASCATC